MLWALSNFVIRILKKVNKILEINSCEISNYDFENLMNLEISITSFSSIDLDYRKKLIK